jgi:hypothetical protein
VAELPTSYIVARIDDNAIFARIAYVISKLEGMADTNEAFGNAVRELRRLEQIRAEGTADRIHIDTWLLEALLAGET